MATFLELQNLVRGNVIDLPTVVTNNVPTYINRAIVSLQNAHTFKVNEILSGPTLTATGTRVLMAAPATFKEARGDPWYLTSSGVRVPMRWAPDRASAMSAFNSGTNDRGPPAILVDAEPAEDGVTRNFEVYPLPDGASDYSGGQYRIYIPYIRYVTALSADGDTNWFTTHAEEYIEQMATAYAFYADWDETRGALWTARAMGAEGQPGKGGKMREAINRDKRFRLAATDTLVPLYQGVNSPRVRF